MCNAVTEWKLGVVKSYIEGDGFHFTEFPCELNEGESISQNDLLLLSKDKVVSVSQWKHCFSPKPHWRILHKSVIGRETKFVDGKKLRTVFAFALMENVPGNDGGVLEQRLSCFRVTSRSGD
ncbi:hypothetical protein PIB30_006689 [Stylosanthes scabra]|uniref:Uncharacterized protein n=1 Tax=Stylosanthes scabra TaxID=79078 RepID=A0ABU6S4C3_9FABA|nr:hypothetical protein [Stylosanthes scabra]